MNELLTGVAAVATALSTGYCALCVWAGVQFSRRRSSLISGPQDLPPVSIMKPLKGTDPEMYECLRSHCLQHYSQYEILFGIADPNDPASVMVDRLRDEFPAHDIRLLHCEDVMGTNGKVSTLAQMAKVAKHDLLLVNDSDVRVPPDYLRTVMGELQQPHV